MKLIGIFYLFFKNFATELQNQGWVEDLHFGFEGPVC